MRLLLLVITFGLFVQCKSDKVTPHMDDAITDTTKTPVVKHVDVVGAKEMIKAIPDLVIIDARTPMEYAAGTLPNAINIDVKADDFAEKIDALDKSATYLMHCKSGKRSMKASEIMIELGFLDVTNMDGGYLAWIKTED